MNDPEVMSLVTVSNMKLKNIEPGDIFLSCTPYMVSVTLTK